MGNDFMDFLNFGAVVEIKRGNRNDLYYFVNSIIKLGFLNNEINWFINAMKITGDKKLNNDMTIKEKIQILNEEYTDDNFWHLIDINDGRVNSICIEYQYGKGFTFGKKDDYINYDDTIKVLSVNDLRKALK